MANLKFNFTFKGKAFCLCCTVCGTSIRHYREVSGKYKLYNPDFDLWDKNAQMFIETTKESEYNNTVLREMLEYYQSLYKKFSSTMDIVNGKVLFGIDERSTELCTDKPMTFGDFVKQQIYDGRHEHIRKPSKNYLRYVSFLHKLEGEGVIIHKYLKDICNADFISFGKYMLNDKVKKGQCNYANYMQIFKSVHTRAYALELNDNILRYPYMKDAPLKRCSERVFLTVYQYHLFCTMNLDCISQSGPKRLFYKDMYRDFCVFLYEMKMRPCDALRLHKSNISERHIIYVAEKKKNYLDERKRTTRVAITDKASEIIQKYDGMSSKGYIFPFAMNNYDYDFNDPESWNKWYDRKQKALLALNNYLHKFEKILGVSPITAYTFRHTAFTHAINKENSNLMKIAKEGATSIKMLESHYYHIE